jgi:hypothetical protein
VVVLWANGLPFNRDTLTLGHIVFFFTQEFIMQIRSANAHTSSTSKVANPIIIAFGRNWEELYRAPLSQIQGMAYGTREDYESGYRGIKHNWCTSPAGEKVYAWATPSI